MTKKITNCKNNIIFCRIEGEERMAFKPFTGSYDHTIDAKGRVVIPSKYRERLGNTVTLAIGGVGEVDGMKTLTIYPESIWIEKASEYMSVEPEEGDVYLYARFMLQNAYDDCQIDSQGRLQLPQALRDKLGIAKELVFIGAGNHIELCSREQNEKNEQYVSEHLGRLQVAMNKRNAGAENVS